MKKIENHLDDILTWEEDQMEDAEVGIVCFGGTARSVNKAVMEARKQGIRVGVFRPITIWPFPEQPLLSAAQKVKHLIVAEHNYGQILLEVERVTKRVLYIIAYRKGGWDHYHAG